MNRAGSVQLLSERFDTMKNLSSDIRARGSLHFQARGKKFLQRAFYAYRVTVEVASKLLRYPFPHCQGMMRDSEQYCPDAGLPIFYHIITKE